MSIVFEITKVEDFQNLLQTYAVVVVDVYADWCSPCKMLAPKYEELATQLSSSQVIFTKHNADLGLGLFDIKSLPSIIFYVNGKEFKTVIGADLPGIKATLQEVGVQSPAVQVQAQERVGSYGTPSVAYKGKNANNQYKTYGSYTS